MSCEQLLGLEHAAHADLAAGLVAGRGAEHRDAVGAQRARRCAAWPALSHISRFIAGATSSGQLRATHTVESRSSAMPCASFAMKSAVAGAITIASTPRESSMCAMLLAKLASQRSVTTGLPVSAWNVAGVDEFRARLGHRDLHFDVIPLQEPRELGRLVGGDAPGDAQQDTAIQDLVHEDILPIWRRGMSMARLAARRAAARAIAGAGRGVAFGRGAARALPRHRGARARARWTWPATSLPASAACRAAFRRGRASSARCPAWARPSTRRSRR